MRQLLFACSLSVLCALPAWAQHLKPTSIYTPLSAKQCQVVRTVAETGGRVHKCRGVGQYALLLLDDDQRMSLTLLAPDGKAYPLELWTMVTTAFSSLGDKAEWRVVHTQGRITPVALIVRMHAHVQDTPEKPRKTSYLVVTKITADAVCVTDRVETAADANTHARHAADAAAQKPCLKPS
jgi:hypothetical protein